MRRRNRIAIYAPRSTGMYERRPVRVGGAERQMALLATSLARRGVPVAHIVFPPSDPSVADADRLTLVSRGAYAGRNGMRSRLTEARRVWRGLAAADSDVYVVRGGSPALGIAALFRPLHRRRLVFSSANDSDFTLETLSGHRHRVALYRVGLESASAIVVQSEHQLGLAREVLRPPTARSSGSPASANDSPTRLPAPIRRRRSCGSGA